MMRNLNNRLIRTIYKVVRLYEALYKTDNYYPLLMIVAAISSLLGPYFYRLPLMNI